MFDVVLGTLVVAILIITMLGTTSPVVNASELSVTVFGDVRDARDKTPTTVIPDDLPVVPGAIVSLPELGVAAVSDANGQFSISVPKVAFALGQAYRKAIVQVTAPGFGAWEVRGAPLYPGSNATRVYVELSGSTKLIDYVPAQEAPRHDPQSRGQELSRPPGLARPLAAGCTGYFSNVYVPGVVKLYRTGSKTIELVNFNFYVRGVLPREWFPSDPREALRAGSLAIKTYSWFWTNYWRGLSSETGECYDLNDYFGNFQDYDPTIATVETDNAVADVWDFKLMQNGAVFDAQYRAGTPGMACGSSDSIMYQYGTTTCANSGHAWWSIVEQYYKSSNGFSRVLMGSGPGVAANPANNDVDVFVKGRETNGSIYQRYRRGDAWYGWHDLGAPPVGGASDPSASYSNNGNRLDVVVRGNDGRLWNNYWQPTTGWVGWQDRGGSVTTGPAVAGRRSSVVVDALTRDPDNALQSWRYDGFNWSTTGGLGAPPASHGSSFVWGPAATYWQSGDARIDAVVASNDLSNQLYYKFNVNDGGWTPSWSLIGGGTSSAAGLAGKRAVPGLDLFVRGTSTDQAIYGRPHTGSGWGSWFSIGAPSAGTASGPGAAWASGPSGTDSELHVFVRGHDHQIWSRYRIGGNWSIWFSLGAPP